MQIIFHRQVKGVNISSVVNEDIEIILSLFIFFYEKILSTKKTQIKPKPTNKTKISKY